MWQMNHVKGEISLPSNKSLVKTNICGKWTMLKVEYPLFYIYFNIYLIVQLPKIKLQILECTKLNKSVGIIVRLFSLSIQVKIILECYLYPFPMNYLPFIRSHLANGRFSRLLHYLKDISTIKNLSKFNLNREKMKKNWDKQKPLVVKQQIWPFI